MCFDCVRAFRAFKCVSILRCSSPIRADRVQGAMGAVLGRAYLAKRAGELHRSAGLEPSVLPVAFRQSSYRDVCRCRQLCLCWRESLHHHKD